MHLNGHVARRNCTVSTIIWDRDLAGFGLRCRAGGYKAWVVKLRERGRQRFVTLGSTDTLEAPKARAQARLLLERAALDGLPASRSRSATAVPIFAEYLPVFWRDYARHWKPSTQASNLAYAKRELLPQFGHRRLAELTRSDIVRWRDDLVERPAIFNRSLPVLAVALGYAEKLGYRPKASNPCKGVPRYERTFPNRYLSSAEYQRLGRSLAELEPDHPRAAAAIRLLALTGARRGEILSLRWEHLLSDRLVLPDSKTGPKIIWLNAPARELLASLSGRFGSGWIFPAVRVDKPLSLDPLWYRLRRAAGLPDVRLHDLRHSFASIGIADRLPLYLIGRLLGHSLPESTARYAHLADEVLAEAADRVCDGLAQALGMTS